MTSRFGPATISWLGLSSQSLRFQALAVVVDRPLLPRVVGDRLVVFDCIECCIGLAHGASSPIGSHFILDLDAGK